MKKTVVVAGATGNLGERICRELIKKQVQVKAIVRKSADVKKVDALIKMGVEISEVNVFTETELTSVCIGAMCVVSALTGLHEVIVEAQLQLLKAAISAGAKHFIPSDFSSDFTLMPNGENRNFDLRREFHQYLDTNGIRVTSIFNGCFADIIKYNTPLFDQKNNTVAYYHNKKDWKIDFTTMDDTAAYTASVAVDPAAPRFLRIASFRLSPADLANLSEQYKNKRFSLVDMGTLEDFSAHNKIMRAEYSAGENELYPKWQQAQYLYSMFLVQHPNLDNSRYPDLTWSKVEENI